MRDYVADFDFDNVEFGDETDQDLDILGMTDGIESDLDLTDMSNAEYMPEINVTAPMPMKSAELIASQVEDTLIDLLSRGDIKSMQVLTGQTHNDGSVLADFETEFKNMYATACSHNAALKWYGRLASALPKKFAVNDNGLTVSMNHKAFDKCIAPFLAELDHGLQGSSPIVELMASLVAQFRASKVAAQEEMVLNTQEYTDNEDVDGFDVTDADFSGEQFDIEATVRYEDDGAISNATC